MATAATMMTLAGCASAPPRHAPDRPVPGETSETDRRIGAEVERICALPEQQRAVELEKMQRESGMTLYCGK